MTKVSFEWDEEKEKINKDKHGVSFTDARKAFEDTHRIIIQDLGHSSNEQRYFCLGKVESGVLTVRFTYRNKKIRIFGAGYWRAGRRRYDTEQKESEIHR